MDEMLHISTLLMIISHFNYFPS